jgi:hypothetical protein
MFHFGLFDGFWLPHNLWLKGQVAGVHFAVEFGAMRSREKQKTWCHNMAQMLWGSIAFHL